MKWANLHGPSSVDHVLHDEDVPVLEAGQVVQADDLDLVGGGRVLVALEPDELHAHGHALLEVVAVQNVQLLLWSN